MPQANAHYIRHSQIAKMTPLEVIDAINARIEYATCALTFAEAFHLMESGGYERDVAEGIFESSDAHAVALRSLAEIKLLANNLHEKPEQKDGELI